MAGSRRSSRPAPIHFNDDDILSNLTGPNLKRIWASRRIVEDQLYLIHVQGAAGIGRHVTVVVKKFLNVDGIVDGNVECRWKSEMIMLAFIRHENIVQVLHVIRREDVIMLVYEHAVNGSLHHWLHRWEEHGGRPLSWPERIRIAIGVAQGLCHMHHGCNKPVVHNNINSTNILLDEQLNAKITSFGAAQLNMDGLNQPLPIVDLHAGNFGYAAPEYGPAGRLTEKVDTYSIGVVLQELVTGRVANGEDGQLAIWARNNCDQLMANKHEGFKEVVDKGIPHQARYMKEMSAVFKLGVACTVENPQQRPSMMKVLGQLRRARGMFSALFTW